MAKVGISQGNPLAALGNILRKGPGRGAGRDSKSPRRESPITKKSSLEGSKESVRDIAKDSPELSRRTSEPKSPKMFRFGIRRSSSRSKKGDRDDSASDTSSVNSLNAVSVKEDPMEVESSSLTVSRSAGENSEKEDKVVARKDTDQASSMSTGDASKSANRNSTYFKPPEVEPLTDLFASGELDALLKTNEESVIPVSNEAEVQEEKVDDADAEEQAGSGSGLKRNNLRSSFKMYENRYREETLERKKKDKSPLSTNLSTAAKPPKDEIVLTNTAPVEKTQNTICVDDTDTLYKSASLEGTNEAERKQGVDDEKKRDKENQRRRRRLFDDELFQSDLPTKSVNRVKTSSMTAPSLDAYAKAHRSQSPVDVVSQSPVDVVVEKIEDGEEKDEGDKGDVNSCVSPNTKDCGGSQSEQFNEESTLTSLSDLASEQLFTTPTAETTHKSNKKGFHIVKKEEAVPMVHSHTDEGSSVKESLDDKGPPKTSHIPTSRKDSPVLKKTELEIESDKRENEKRKPTEVEIVESSDKDTIPEHTLPPVNRQEREENKTEKEQSEIDASTVKVQSDKESLNERVANRIRRRREEKEKEKASRSTRSYDSRSRIESGKVSSAKSKLESSSPTASPKMRRGRSSTDSPRLATERKVRTSEGANSASSSWMSDLQKKREQRAKEKETTSRIKATTAESAEDMPDWRKRALERRKRAEEAKTANVVKKTEQSTPLARSRRNLEADGRSTKTEKIFQNSDEKKSSSSTKKITRTTKPAAKGMNEGDNTELKEKDESDFGEIEGNKVDPISGEQSLETSCTSPKPEVTSPKPEVTSPKADVTSPKPEITSPKPKIQIVTRKVVKTPSSSESMEGEICAIDVKPLSKGEVSQEKNEAKDDVFVPDAKNETASVCKDSRNSSQSPSNLQNQVPSESQSGTGSRKNSNSSEQDIGTPFHSRSISHSRSPTPTSMTPGPLKLPTDPVIPEWKKRVLERKKDGSLPKKPQSSVKTTEAEPPAWKKDLLAKRSKGGVEVIK